MRWATSPRSPDGAGRSRWALRAVACCCALLAAAWAAPPPKVAPGRLLGVVTDALGQPLPHAVVRLTPDAGSRTAGGTRQWVRRTPADGVFRFSGLAPGLYWVEAGAGARVLARRRIRISASRTSYLALPLLSVLRTIRLAAPDPAAARRFAWVVRTDAARPALRWRQAGDTAGGAAAAAGVNGYVTFMAGTAAQPLGNDGAWSTNFAVEHALWGESELALSADMGVASAGQNGGSGMRVAFAPQGDSGQARMIFGVQQLPLPALAGAPELRVYTFNLANGMDVTPRLKVQYGVMVDDVALASAVHQIAPYARVRWRVNPHATIEYRFASATPPVHFAPHYAESGDPAPRLSVAAFAPQIEQAQHQEVAYTDDLSPYDQLSIAVFHDAFTHAAVSGSGADATDLAAGYLLPDAFSNMFSADGGSYSGAGARVVYARQLAHGMDAVVEWSDGPVLAPRAGHGTLRDGRVAPLLAPAQRQAVTLKWAAVIPFTGSHITCSYRWLDGSSATALDPYDDTFGRSNAFANVAIRQPLPDFGWAGGKVTALAEFHNLLAQGYIPVISADGHLLYLIQSARSFRGGLSINF